MKSGQQMRLHLHRIITPQKAIIRQRPAAGWDSMFNHFIVQSKSGRLYQLKTLKLATKISHALQHLYAIYQRIYYQFNFQHEYYFLLKFVIFPRHL